MKHLAANDVFKQMARCYEKIFDIVRVVDPVSKETMIFKKDKLIPQNAACYSLWNIDVACQDCIAGKALKEYRSFVKMQYNMQKMYLIFVVPLKVDKETILIEMLKDITDNLVFETVDQEHGHEVRNIISDLNGFLLKDSLTDLYNRRYIYQMLPAEIMRSNENEHYMSIVMADIDCFKSINDTYGHYVGDVVIKTFAEIMTKFIRKDVDWAARYGGDEFLIFLRGVDSKKAAAIVERIRKAVENTLIKVEGAAVKITASFGICTVKKTGMEAVELIKCADSRLYEAKEQGRNKVVS